MLTKKKYVNFVYLYKLVCILTQTLKKLQKTIATEKNRSLTYNVHHT